MSRPPKKNRFDRYPIVLFQAAATLSWLLAGPGFLWSLLVSFAAGMKTVPRLEFAEAVGALILPILSAGIALLVIRVAGHRKSEWIPFAWTLPPLMIDMLSIALIVLPILF